MRARLSTFRSLDPVRPDAAEHRPRPAAGSEPNPPLRSPNQSVWVASFSSVAMASFSSVVDNTGGEKTHTEVRCPSRTGRLRRWRRTWQEAGLYELFRALE